MCSAVDAVAVAVGQKEKSIDFFFSFFFRDDHRFSLLHWACREGRTNIVDMLIVRGARINATNLGDDTPLHLAAGHGHRDVVLMVGFFLFKLMVGFSFSSQLIG